MPYDPQKIKNEAETEVALTIDHFCGNGDTFKKLQEIQDSEPDINTYYNYVLRCTDGMFKGKFLYVNTTPDGELFGSGDPEELDLTMYIESANLSEKHAEIKFVDNCKYILRDCGSETGTWTRIGRPGDSLNEQYLTGGIDLYQESRMRMYKAGDYQFVIEEHPLKEFNEVSSWLKANYFPKCMDIFEMKQIRTL